MRRRYMYMLSTHSSSAGDSSVSAQDRRDAVSTVTEPVLRSGPSAAPSYSYPVFSVSVKRRTRVIFYQV